MVGTVAGRHGARRRRLDVVSKSLSLVFRFCWEANKIYTRLHSPPRGAASARAAVRGRNDDRPRSGGFRRHGGAARGFPLGLYFPSKNSIYFTHRRTGHGCDVPWSNDGQPRAPDGPMAPRAPGSRRVARAFECPRSQPLPRTYEEGVSLGFRDA